MMELYKEALELHGVDPNKVRHGGIVDEKGVTGQKVGDMRLTFTRLPITKFTYLKLRLMVIKVQLSNF